LTCKKIIIATGREAKKLMVDDVDKLTGKGISYCALCDGALAAVACIKNLEK